MLIQHVVEERKAAAFSADGALADAGEPDGVVEGVGVEAGNHAQALAHTVFVDALHGRAAVQVHVLEVGVLDGHAFLEQASGQHPAGNVVLALEALELFFGETGDDFLRSLEVVGAGKDLPLFVQGHEVSEAEFPADELGQVVGEGLGALHQEAGVEFLGHASHALLGALHEDGHLGQVFADHLAQVYAGVQFLGGGLVSPVQHEADVGDDAEEILLVLVVQGYGVVVVGGHEDLGPGPFAEDHLLFVEGVPDGGHVLLEHQLIEKGKIGGVVAHRVFYQQDALHAALEDVGGGIHAVFQQFDDGNDKVCASVPVEDVVHGRVVSSLQLAVDLLGKGSEQHDGHAGAHFLHAGGEVEYVHFAHVIEGDDQVPALTGSRFLQRFAGGGDPLEDGRAAQVEVGVFLRDAHVQPAVFLQRKVVVIVAYQQNPPDSAGHERC